MLLKLNDKDWLDEDEGLLPEDGDWEVIAPGVERLRKTDGAPIRTIGTGRRNRKVGALYSYKCGCHVAHESEFECTLAKILEVHPDVSRFHGQPETLRIHTEGDEIKKGGTGPTMTYTPDFLAAMGFSELRIEFKLAEALRPPPPKNDDDLRGYMLAEEASKLRRRFRFVRQAYRDAGLVWICLTEIELRNMADETTVGDIIANGGREIEPTDLERLVSTLEASPGQALPLSLCEEVITHSDFPRGAILARIPERVVHVNLNEKISSDTMIYLTERRS